MSLTLYKLRIRCLLRNYENLFWSFGFPMLLSLFFYMGYGNIVSNEKVVSIPIAIVSNESENNLIQCMKKAELTKGKKLFLVHKKTLNNARDMLIKGKIDGYIVVDTTLELHIKDNGLNQAIIKSFIDNYIYLNNAINQTTPMDESLLMNNMDVLLKEYKDYVINDNDLAKKADYMVIFYYSIVALTCMFGAFWGFMEMIYIQADQSVVASRINVSPARKLRIVVCNFLAVFTVHYASVLFIILFTRNILGIPYGKRIDMMLITSLLGSLCGISFGAMICVLVKVNTKVRMAIINIVIIVGGFLSGMVIVDMKYTIAVHAPVLAYINPSNLITDAFYCIYYYDSYPRLFNNLLMLLLFTIVFWCITYHEIRRRVYASI